MLIRLLRDRLRPYAGLIALVAVLQLVQAGANLFLPSLNADIIDDGVAKGDTATILRLGGVMLAVTLVQGGYPLGATITEWPNMRKPSSKPALAVSTSQIAFWNAIDCAMMRWWCTRSAGGSG